MSTTTHHSAMNYYNGHLNNHNVQSHQPQQQQQQQQQYSRNVIENVIKSLDQLILANNVKQVIDYNRQINKLLNFNNNNNHDYQIFGLQKFFRLKNALNVKTVSKWNRVASILKTLYDKANQKEYQTFRQSCQKKQILVIGGGISGLRVSIELLLLGCKVICVEKRDEFTRNNVIHLWPNVINDMCTFEAKRFYGKFCVGSIDHVSIRQLQLILLKIAIIYGLEFYTNTTFTEICPRIIEPRFGRCTPTSCNCCCHQHGFGEGSYAHFAHASVDDSITHSAVNYLNRQSFDVIIGCDGRRHTFNRYFRRNNRRGKLAIGLTANFINHRTEEEVQCEEISGVSRIYQQQWFQNLQDETGIELENLVYYRDNTHYFVMTATKSSLLLRGVLKTDYSDSHQLLSMDNIDTHKLMQYSKDAAEWSSKLRRLEFARNSNNMPDVALFDFTSMYSATNASCAKKIYLRCCDTPVNMNASENSRYLLLLLCGDSLLEPFWPTGSGAGRGFLSAMDAAWTVAQWFSMVDDSYPIDSMLNVISRREFVYRLLAQTSPENTINKNFTIDPQTRYKNLNILTRNSLKEIKEQVRHLIIEKPDIDMKIYRISNEAKRARRATIGIDPNDILKAKNLTVDTSKLDEFVNINNHDLIDYQRNHPLIYSSVPSADVNDKNYINRQQNCDNNSLSAASVRSGSRSPIEVVEFLPRNHQQQSSTTNHHNLSRRHLDAQPRNDRIISNMTKKNHHARNHFFQEKTDEDTDINHNNASHYAQRYIMNQKRQQQQNSSQESLLLKQNNYNQKNNYNNDKENCPIPNFKQMFLLNDNFNDVHQQKCNDNYPQTKSRSSSSIINNNRMNLITNLFDSSTSNNRHSFNNDDMLNFEKSISRKPIKKSLDILEKAQYLEQKFEEQNRAYQPNLNRVGRIEEDDWNVKIWNDTNLFAPKIDKSGRPYVGENSRDLLQSRIAQLNNNFEYNRPMLAKTFLSTTLNQQSPQLSMNNNSNKNSEYVTMLSNEVCQKLNNSTKNDSNITLQPSNDISAKNYNAPTSPSITDSTMNDSMRITSAFRNHNTFLMKPDPLKPIGDCKRCSKTLIANDRVTISGRNFHRNCLTCKICNVSLRHDELMASLDDFICKICSKLRSRQMIMDDSNNNNNNESNTDNNDNDVTDAMSNSCHSSFINSTTSSNNRNREAFMLSQTPLSSSFNSSLMEAKKNFLENIQQIDLRERAEFELSINDDDDDGKINDLSNIDANEAFVDDADDDYCDETNDDYFDDVDDQEIECKNDDNDEDQNEITEHFNDSNGDKIDHPVDNHQITEVSDNITDDVNVNDDERQHQLQQRQQSSDLSDSSNNIQCSSDNYTDDEQSSTTTTTTATSSSSLCTNQSCHNRISSSLNNLKTSAQIQALPKSSSTSSASSAASTSASNASIAASTSTTHSSEKDSNNFNENNNNDDYRSGFTSLINTTTNTPTTIDAMNDFDDNNNDNDCLILALDSASSASISSPSTASSSLKSSRSSSTATTSLLLFNTLDASPLLFNDDDLACNNDNDMNESEPLIVMDDFIQNFDDSQPQHPPAKSYDDEVNDGQNGQTKRKLSLKLSAEMIDNECATNNYNNDALNSKIALHSKNFPNELSLISNSIVDNNNRINEESFISRKTNINNKEQDKNIETSMMMTFDDVVSSGSQDNHTLNSPHHNRKNSLSDIKNQYTSTMKAPLKIETPAAAITSTVKPPPTTTTAATTTTSNKPTYRYSGHFTEKFYRSLSQPSLLAQMDSIGEKLSKMKKIDPSIDNNHNSNNKQREKTVGTKLKSSIPVASSKSSINQLSSQTNHSKSQIDLLPFVDEPHQQSPPSPSNSNQLSSFSRIPFATIDDV